MTAFGPDQAEGVLANCQAAVEAIGAAFSAALGGEFEAQPAAPEQLDLNELPTTFAGAGLVFGFTVAQTRCLAVLSRADGLLPQWCLDPDDEGSEKLNQLGIDLAKSLLPPANEAQFAGVAFERDLAAALRASQPNGDSTCLKMEIAKADRQAQLSLIWPVASFVHAIESTVAGGNDTPGVAQPGVAEPGVAELRGPGKLPKHRRLIYRNLEEGIRQLPAYAKSLLRVQVPVTVTLATAKTTVSKIVEMAPGTILQFKKACDSNLTMEVGRQTVAEGEAVKVGDKFGLWITSITMPGERFWSVSQNSSAKRVK